MNNAILKKVIDALKEKEPKIEYVLGMLETLYEMSEQIDAKVASKYILAPGVVTPMFPGDKGFGEKSDEVTLMDAQARAAVETIKSLGGAQTE